MVNPLIKTFKTFEFQNIIVAKCFIQDCKSSLKDKSQQWIIDDFVGNLQCKVYDTLIQTSE